MRSIMTAARASAGAAARPGRSRRRSGRFPSRRREPRHRDGNRPDRLRAPPGLAAAPARARAAVIMDRMEGSAPDSVGTRSSWLRCYRCWSQNLEVQVHYQGLLKVDAETGDADEPVEETHEAVVQCLDCLHDQPHLCLLYTSDA